jgi:hypothetical protein
MGLGPRRAGVQGMFDGPGGGRDPGPRRERTSRPRSMAARCPRRRVALLPRGWGERGCRLGRGVRPTTPTDRLFP